MRCEKIQSPLLNTWTYHFGYVLRKEGEEFTHAYMLNGNISQEWSKASEKMADMDETGQPTAFEEDPAAAFLAREQDELAEIADDTLGFTPGASEVSWN